MSISIAKAGDRVVIDILGQLVVENRLELKQCVVDELGRGERKFRIDFRAAGYVDSSGLGTLVSLSKRIRELHGELRLANLSKDLRSLFQLTRLDALFQIDNDDDDGLVGRPAPLRPRPSDPLEGAADGA